MSKTVTIPADLSRIEITINGVQYTYKGGETVTVPDEVAALLETNAANRPSGTRPVEDPKNAGLYDGEDFIPVYTDSKGALRIKKSDVQGAVPASGGGAFIVTVEDGETENTYVADKTFAEIAAAAEDQVVVCRYLYSNGSVYHAYANGVAESYITFTGPADWAAGSSTLSYLFIEIGTSSGSDYVTVAWTDITITSGSDSEPA